MSTVNEDWHNPEENKPNTAAAAFVGRFAAANFSEGMVTNFFKGPQPLYASQIFIPVIQADKGPQEFNLADKVKPRRWVIVYRGKVVPPESGKYRFVGMADDYMIVRFRGRIVLDGGLAHPTGKKPAKTFNYAGIPGTYGFGESDLIEVTAGDKYDIDILVGEQPGGQFCAFLLLEKDGLKYETDPKGGPILPVFKFGPVESKRTGNGFITTMPDQSWSVWKAEAPL